MAAAPAAAPGGPQPAHGAPLPPAQPAPPQAGAWPPPQTPPGFPSAAPPQGGTGAAGLEAAPPGQQVYVIGEPKRRPMPAWLAAVFTLAVIGGGLFLLYRYISSSGEPRSSAKKATPFESPQAQGSAHPFARHVEVTGIRLLETSDKKLAVRFVVVNHAPAELTGFRLRISLEAANAKPGEALIAVVDATPGAIPAYGVKDMEAPLVTPLKVYELPDWQFVRTRIEISDLK